METGTETVAARIFVEVLADFAFVFGSPQPPAELPGLDGQGYLARLPFRGGATGSFSLGVPELLALEIAANTLGVDPADPSVVDKAVDAVKEVVSVLGGHLADQFERPGAKVLLSPPQLYPLDRMEWNRLRADAATRCFVVDGHPVLFRMEMNPGEAKA